MRITRLPALPSGRANVSYICLQNLTNRLREKQGWPNSLPSRVTLVAGQIFLHINTYARPAGSTRRRRDNQSMRERLWLGQTGHLTHAEVDSVEWLFYPGKVFSIFGLLKFIKKSIRIPIVLGPFTSTSSWRFFIVHTFNHTLGARDFSYAVSDFCQAARDFGLRPKMCGRHRSIPLLPRVVQTLVAWKSWLDAR